jgi:hypothetical protein
MFLKSAAAKRCRRTGLVVILYVGGYTGVDLLVYVFLLLTFFHFPLLFFELLVEFALEICYNIGKSWCTLKQNYMDRTSNSLLMHIKGFPTFVKR